MTIEDQLGIVALVGLSPEAFVEPAPKFEVKADPGKPKRCFTQKGQRHRRPRRDQIVVGTRGVVRP